MTEIRSDDSPVTIEPSQVRSTVLLGLGSVMFLTGALTFSYRSPGSMIATIVGAALFAIAIKNIVGSGRLSLTIGRHGIVAFDGFTSENIVWDDITRIRIGYLGIFGGKRCGVSYQRLGKPSYLHLYPGNYSVTDREFADLLIRFCPNFQIVEQIRKDLDSPPRLLGNQD